VLQATKEELDQTKLKLQEAALKISNLNTLVEKNEVIFRGKIQEANDVARIQAVEKDKLLGELDARKRESDEVNTMLRLEVVKGDAVRAQNDGTKKRVLDLATASVSYFLDHSVTDLQRQLVLKVWK
jgi:predicted DNA-binding ribbon-helix-helix protein